MVMVAPSIQVSLETMGAASGVSMMTKGRPVLIPLKDTVLSVSGLENTDTFSPFMSVALITNTASSSYSVDTPRSLMVAV